MTALSSSQHAAARPLWADIDLGAVTHNITLLRRQAGRRVKLLVPVKANAYGHGAAEVGRHLATLGVEGLATANVDDALAIRATGVTVPILIYGAQLPEGNRFLLEHDLTPTVYSADGLHSVSAAATELGVTAAVHVKVDAGMGRLGVAISEAQAFVREVVATPHVRLEGLYTHIPFSDETGREWSRGCLGAFTTLVRKVEAEHDLRIDFAQAAASSVTAAALPDELNTVAPGHLTFGLNPLSGARAEDLGYRKALTAVRAQLIQVRDRRGVVLLGMDNGYRNGPAGTGAYMLCRGQRCPVIGVSAEYTVLDLSAMDAAEVGDVVTIVGRDGDEELAVEDVARHLGAPSAAYWMLSLKAIPYRYFR